MPKPADQNLGAPARRRLGLGVAALAGMGGAGFGWWRFAPRPVPDDGADLLWSHALLSPEGQAMDLRPWRGQKLLVNFWATWCAPCVRELPLLDGFAARQAQHGIRVAALALDKPEPVQRFLARQPLRFAVATLVPAGGIALTRSLGNEAGGLPFSLLLAADGRVRERKIGELEAQDLERWAALA